LYYKYIRAGHLEIPVFKNTHPRPKTLGWAQ
jgi:hypothetical protein